MSKEELFNLLKENMDIYVSLSHCDNNSYIRVTTELFFDGNKIAEDTDTLRIKFNE
jgi:hypothetical protein